MSGLSLGLTVDICHSPERKGLEGENRRESSFLSSARHGSYWSSKSIRERGVGDWGEREERLLGPQGECLER